MNKFAKKLATGAISAAIAISMIVPVAFAAETIDGNGNGSDNTIIVTNSSSCSITQTNKTGVLASVSASSNTGGNTANGNTGDGGVTIDTGKADATATLTVTGGDNTITDPCCCSQPAVPPADRLIKDNGNNSVNTIVSSDTPTTSLTQRGRTRVAAQLKAKAKTGKNKANNNTGNGLVEVITDNATSTTGLIVTGGNNTLN